MPCFRLFVLAACLCAPAPSLADQTYALVGTAKASAAGAPSSTVDLDGGLVLRDDRTFSMTLSGGGNTEEFTGAWLQEGSAITMLMDTGMPAIEFIEALEDEASAEASRAVTVTAMKFQEKVSIDSRGGLKMTLRSQFVFRAQGISRPLKVKEQIKLTGVPTS